ncbi:MAG: LptA/OstA family protein [Allosphingosinicella sp.]
MKRLIPLMLLAVLGPASAYGQVSALKGHNSDAPIDVASDRIEVQDRADRAIFSGNVVVRQGDLTLTAPRITVAYSSAGGIQVRRVDASGGVTVKSPSETASGNVGIYDTEARLITLIGDVRLVQKDAKVNGGRLTIDLDSGRAVMDGGGPPGTTRQGGRVTGTFTMPPRKTS